MPFLGLLIYVFVIVCDEGHVLRVQEFHLIQSIATLGLEYEFSGVRFKHEASYCVVKRSLEQNVDVCDEAIDE